MAKSRRRRPRHKVEPRIEKQPRAVERPELNADSILWSFERFDDYDEWSKHCPQHGFCAVAKHMKDYEGRTWKEIWADESRDHWVECHRLDKLARERLRRLKLDYVDCLLRFQFGGKERLWGIKEGAVFCVLWWDPAHRVCPSIKRHT